MGVLQLEQVNPNVFTTLDAVGLEVKQHTGLSSKGPCLLTGAAVHPQVEVFKTPFSFPICSSYAHHIRVVFACVTIYYIHHTGCHFVTLGISLLHLKLDE